jgi:hypothetical protein
MLGDYETRKIFNAFWAGAGTTNAPPADEYQQGSLGANNDGASTANVYHVVRVAGVHTWVDTGATVANIYGA